MLTVLKNLGIKKIIIIGLIILTLCATAFNVYNSIINKIAPDYFGLTSLAPAFIALYNESDFVYQKFNKIRAFIKNNTVAFKPAIRIDLKEDSNIEEIYHDVFDFIDKFNLKYKEKNIIKTYDSITINDVSTPNNLNFKIVTSLISSGNNQRLIINFEYQLSSRSVKNTWEEFKKYKDFLISRHTPDKYLFTLKLKLNNSNLNPFYKITIKKIKPFTIDLVDIKLKNKDITLNIQKNEIYATSNDLIILDDVVNSYIPLTNVY